MVNVTVQGIVQNTVHTHLWTQPLTIILDHKLTQSSENGSSVYGSGEGEVKAVYKLLVRAGCLDQLLPLLQTDILVWVFNILVP